MKLYFYLTMIVLSGVASSAYANLSVFACEPEWAALATELGGDNVDVYSATNGLQDPHHIQARPSLIAKIRNTDLVACTGADLEVGWLPLLLQRASNDNVQVGKPGYFMATQFVKILGIPQQIDRSQGDVHAAGNPHIQTSPLNILPVARALDARMRQLDPVNSALYQSRLADFETRWKAALSRWQSMAEPLNNLPIVVHHENWIYLEDWLHLNQVATLEEKPGLPPTSGHLSEVLKQMKSSPAKIIIHAAYQSEKPSRWLSEKTGIPVVDLPFSIGGTEGAKDLFSLYDDTLQRLLKAVSP